LGEQELLNELQRSHDRVIQRLGTWNVESPARERYVLRRSAELLGRVIRAQRRVAHQGRAVPVGTEIPFGIDPPGRGLPALSLLTPSGRTVTVRGFIDRVDLAELGDEMLGIVIDYKKSREKQLNMAAVYHGLSLQLLAYLLVIGESGRTLAGRPIRPGGALYVNLVPRYERVLHPDRQGPRSQDVAPAYRPRGLISSVALGALDQDESPGWSRAYSVFRKADGTVGNLDHSDAADDTDLTRLLSHTKSKLAGLADGILDGQFSVRPFRLGDLNPCSWCPVKAVCRFEMGLCEVRFLERLPRSEVFRRLASDD
jgi:ATP-dependent helicase/nuclease subunit B